MAVRGSARILAPLALIASVLGVLVIVLVSQVDTASVSVPSTHRTVTTQSAKPHKRIYVVKPGDNLTVIAEKTGVSIETIERLNPSINPQALAAGARLKLTP